MIKRIKIDGFKSLRDVTIELNELSILFGPNAVGKSNFLDALQLLSGMATKRTLKESFDYPFRGDPLECFSFSSGGISNQFEHDKMHMSIEVDVELSSATIEKVTKYISEMKKSDVNGHTSSTKRSIHEKYLRYALEIELTPKNGFLYVVNEYLVALTKYGSPRSNRSPFIERKDEKLHLRLEGQAHPRYYDLRLDHTIVSSPLYPPHYPHAVAFREELSNWFNYYFEPREVMRKPNSIKEVRHIGLMGEELAAFLNTLKSTSPNDFMAIETALRAIIPSIKGIELVPNSIGQIEFLLLEGEDKIPAGVLSEGTLRLLGLLSLPGAQNPPALICFEEPENGVHPKRLRSIADLLRNISTKSQVIATTHSPILPNYIGNDHLFVVKKRNNKTIISKFDPWGEVARESDISKHLDDDDDDHYHSISHRILRGDFDE